MPALASRARPHVGCRKRLASARCSCRRNAPCSPDSSTTTHTRIGERHEEESARILPALAAAGLIVAGPPDASASSHMDAPLIILTMPRTRLTSMRSSGAERTKSLVTALGVYPYEEPGIGPNKYNFDDNVLYEIHVAMGKDVAAGGRRLVPFRFKTRTRPPHDPAVLSRRGQRHERRGQNLAQIYTVTKVDHRSRPADPARHGHRAAEQPGHRHAVLQPGRRRRAAGQGGVATADSSTATRSSRSPVRRRLSRLRRPARRRLLRRTFSPSSICCSCAIPARIRSVDSTST